MTPGAIREGFERLRDGAEQPLANAAACRACAADWYGGHQRHARHDGFQFPAGRVPPDHRGPGADPHAGHRRGARGKNQKIHPARDYWEVLATFRAAAGNMPGAGSTRRSAKTPTMKKRGLSASGNARAPRPSGQCASQPATVSRSKPATQLSPLLFDLTSPPRREANSRFGFSARRTLQIAQALYERYKVLTYPRTDSRALPEDYQSTVRQVLTNLAPEAPRNNWRPAILQHGWVSPTAGFSTTPRFPTILRSFPPFSR